MTNEDLNTLKCATSFEERCDAIRRLVEKGIFIFEIEEALDIIDFERNAGK